MKTVREMIKDLPSNHVIYINALKIDQMITGVITAKILKNKSIELTYEDNTKESRQLNDEILDSDVDDQSLLRLTSFVQEIRSRKNV